MSLFLRLLEDDDKGAALEAAVQSVAKAEPDSRVFEVESSSFEQVPEAPFAYWVGEEIRRTFQVHPALEGSGRIARLGAHGSDDFRWIRNWWESIDRSAHSQGVWKCLAKGGKYSPFYSELHLLVEWDNHEQTLLGFQGRKGRAIKKPESVENYFRPGLTWPRRTNGLSFRVMPAGCMFADKGPAAFLASDDPNSLLALCAVTNSAPFKRLVELQLARTELAQSFEVGLIQRTPVPELPVAESERLALLARNSWSIKRDLDTAELTSHAFVLPALMQVDGADLAARVVVWSKWLEETGKALAKLQAEIDALCLNLYGFDAADRISREGGDSNMADRTLPADGKQQVTPVNPEKSCKSCPIESDLAAELFDWLVGVAFGRFDIRLATGERNEPPVPEPFDQLPVCSPGMLTGDDGLPLEAPPPGYPLELPSDGILVDDAGIDGTAPADEDVIRRIQQVLRILTAETQSAQSGDQEISSPRPLRLRGESLEVDLCKLLGVRSLRDWLRRPNGYFADHLSRYSKSRRKAPILWPLSTESGSYGLWIYYPRLMEQTLYSCVNLHIDPKLQEIERDLSRLLGGGDADSKAQKQIDALVELQRELKSMREKLLRVAKLPYKPERNDGVLITAAPLWRLFRHKPWQRELKKCWDALESGEYDWARLAYAIWPERVREVCKKDKSIAIAIAIA